MAKDGLCSDCGCVREERYRNDSRCKDCRSKLNRARRIALREQKGKKQWGTGRSIYCSICKLEKEKGRDNESCCKKCKSEAGKKRRAKKRLEMGLRPLGSGRVAQCYTCHAIKENPKEGYCRKCANEKDAAWRLRTGRTKNPRTGKCRCGNERASYSNCYCSSCATSWRKKYLEQNPHQREKIYKQTNGRRFQNIDEFIKYVARYTANNAIKYGYLIAQPCEICGKIEGIEAHHDDYTKPLDIRWLCKQHHKEHHKLIKE